MKPETLLDFAVFQLTPTRTRCELLISSKGVSEKLASGLLKPFLSHLRVAEEQFNIGGYSIRLEPPSDNKDWFTKGTVQRFVRFVSTPEVLERVSAVEAELIQLEEELRNYENEGDDQQSVIGSLVINSGGRSFNKSNKELEADGNETSKFRLIKAMEARHSMLQREQGMAFARAVAAGFDIDHLPELLAFAECFGATRLSEACHKFATLCKKQQEGGLWLDEMELVAAEGGGYSFSDTGITIAPAGMEPLNISKPDEDTNLKEKDIEQDESRKESLDNLRRQSSGSSGYIPSDQQQQGFPQMMGMGMPPYGPWVMQMPPPYGNYGQMGPYWGVPPGPYNHANPTHPDNDEYDEEPTTQKTITKKKKSPSPKRKSSSPLKKVQVKGKRSGMVLIRNINYITGSQESTKKKDAEDGSEDESSEFETSSEFEQGGRKKYAYDHGSQNAKSKKSRRKNYIAEHSSEGSHASTSGENVKREINDEMYFTAPLRASRVDSYDAEVIDESLFLNGGRVNGANAGQGYELDENMRSSHRSSKDGMLLPHRNEAGVHNSRNHDSELSFRNNAEREQDNPTGDDSFIIPQRSGFSEAYTIGEAYRDHSSNVNFKDAHPSQEQETSIEDLFIVPSRQAQESSRRAVELEMPAFETTKENQEPTPNIAFEPEDVWMVPERSLGRESIEKKRWNDVDYDMEVMAAMQKQENPSSEDNKDANDEFYDQYHEQRDAKLMKESGSKRAEREARMKSLQDTLDKRKAEISSRFKATRSSILKSKKEKEEADRKRIEELAAERRNRIAARTGGSTASRTSSTVSRTSVPSQRLTGTASKPLTRTLSSTSTNKESPQVKRTPSTRSSLATRSVPSLAELRKENTRPPTTVQKSTSRKQADATPRVNKKSVPGGTEKKSTSLTTRSTSLTRKSIASVRELKNTDMDKSQSKVKEPVKASVKEENVEGESSIPLVPNDDSRSSSDLQQHAATHETEGILEHAVQIQECTVAAREEIPESAVTVRQEILESAEEILESAVSDAQHDPVEVFSSVEVDVVKGSSKGFKKLLKFGRKSSESGGSGKTMTTVPRSFFSLSSFRSKEAKVR